MAKRVLVVDDDVLVRGVTLRMLIGGGYEAEGAADAEWALQLLGAGRPFDLLMVDQRMPGLSGDNFIRVVWATRPQQAVIRLLGNTDDEVTRPLMVQCPTLAKPFSADELLEAVEGCIGKP